ncbi:TolC family protein [Sphingomonas sp. NPDC079357]|uniref:TolC family protein n=1 Tax=Sphingomonas sp. NPDC079357 TaxID=3364518 RepID=UPI003850D68C
MNGFMGRRGCALASTLAALALAGTAAADPAPSFAQLLRRAAETPRVTALEADVAQAEGLAAQGGVRPNPTISVYGENFSGSSPYGGFGRTETTLQLNQPIELGGKRAARIAAGRASVAAAQASGHAGRLAYAYDLARAYGAAEVAIGRIALAQDEVEEATAILSVARALVSAGKEARLRQLQAETEVDAMQAMLEQAKAESVAALAHLAALAGSETSWTALSESLLDRLDARPRSGPVDPMQEAGYRAAEARREAAAQRVTVERTRAVPDLNAQIGVRRLEADNATALVAGVSLPLHVFDSNRGNIAAAQAELRAAEARAAAARLEAQAQARAAQGLVDATDRRAAAAKRTMATAEETYRLARVAYEAGKSPLIELLNARHGLGAARAVVLDAAAARLEARATFARLSGTTITGEPVQ